MTNSRRRTDAHAVRRAREPGGVAVDSAGTNNYEVHSTGTNGDVFYVSRASDGSFSRTCTTTQGPSGANTYGGCVSGGW